MKTLKTRSFFRIWAVLILFTATSAHAVDPYLPPKSIPPTLLAKPHAVGSDAWKQEIGTMIRLQTHADAKEVKAAADERIMTPEMIALTTDPALVREKFPALYHLLDRAGKTTFGIGETVKDYWNMPRPYLADKRVKPLIEPHTNPSYPSGHTAAGYVWAHLLSLLLPEESDEFYRHAERIARHRVLVGMHYPNDLDGGRQLALLVVGGLLQNSEFQKELQAAREEQVVKRVVK